MTKNVFIKSLPVVAMAMGDKMGVQVVMQGSQAKTDGKTIYLPALPEGDDSLWILARGYIDHEAGHVRHTDFSVMEGTPIHRTLTNILEDIRIEQEMGRAYPGCAVNLRNLANHLAREGAFTPDSGRPEQLLLGWILTECRSRVLRQEALAPIARKVHKELKDLLGPPLVGKIEKILANVNSLQSTRQAADLAERIIRLLGQEQKAVGQQQQEQQKDGQQGQENQPGGPGHDHASSSSTSNEDGKKGRKKDGNRGNSASPSDGTGSKLDQNGNHDGHQKSQAAGGSGTDPGQRRRALGKILDEKPGGFGDIGAECAEKLNATSQNSNERDLTGVYPGEASAQDLPLGRPPGLHQVRAETVGLRSRLTRLIQASKLKRSSAGRMGRLVDHRVLHRVPTGDSRVFRRKDEKTAVNTAVLVLLDRSGSMDCGTGRIDLAKKTVMALADALGTVPGVSVAAAVFPGPRSQVVPLTRFGQSVAKSKANYGIGAGGGTPLDRALGWVRAQMAVRQEPRKIVLIATDGEPGNPGATKTMIRKLESEGVEMMGLGILDQGTTGYYFRKHRTITSLQELPEAVFGMLQDALTEK